MKCSWDARSMNGFQQIHQLPEIWVQNEMSVGTCPLLWEVPKNSDARLKWLCLEFLTSGRKGRSKMKNTHHLPSLLHIFFLNHIQEFIPITRLFIPIKQCSDFKCANDSPEELEKPTYSWLPPHPSPEVQTSTVRDRAQESAFLQVPCVILRQMVAKIKLWETCHNPPSGRNHAHGFIASREKKNGICFFVKIGFWKSCLQLLWATGN